MLESSLLPVLMAVPETLLTEFPIHHRLKGCVNLNLSIAQAYLEITPKSLKYNQFRVQIILKSFQVLQFCFATGKEIANVIKVMDV